MSGIWRWSLRVCAISNIRKKKVAKRERSVNQIVYSRPKPTTALLIGRFQPLHKGHEKAIAYLMARYARVVIGMGSSQERRTVDNPFSASEREGMVRLLQKSHPAWSGRIRMVRMADCTRHGAWVASVKRQVPPLEKVKIKGSGHKAMGSGHKAMGSGHKAMGSDRKSKGPTGESIFQSSVVLASANPLVRQLLGPAGYVLRPCPLFRRQDWEGERVRKLIRTGKPWAGEVPAACRGWMQKCGVKIICKTGR
jgi:nicotinamide mononucleotide adenylyltransferase